MRNNFIIMDCETGGLKYKENPITQIGLVVIEPKNFSILDQYETFVKPYGDLMITPEALNASRVSMEEINNGIDYKQVIAKLIEIFRKYTINAKGGKPILVGHNFGFDMDFLNYLFDLVSKDLGDFVDRNWYCTMKLTEIYERKKSTNLSYKLEACCERFGIKLKSAHGALADSMATRDLFKAIMSNVQPSKDKVISVEQEKTTKSRKYFELP